MSENITYREDKLKENKNDRLCSILFIKAFLKISSWFFCM